MKKTILVTGGAGYIGSHTSYLLASHGYNVIIIDKLLHGQNFGHKWAMLIKEDFADKRILEEIFKTYEIHAVMHFAALIEVGESVIRPRDFYENNVIKTAALLNSMIEYGVKKFIYSSSCAVYGNPIKVPIDEQHPKAPISPYGKNKLAVEFMLEDYSEAYGLKYASLRYFNAAGAYPEVGLGEFHVPETHVIPLLLRAILNGKPFKVLGDDYNTIDGTCLRDYIHVRDIADAHIKALDHLNKTETSDCFNLGSGHGYTVRELIKATESVCGSKVKIEYATRRPGDVDVLLADPGKAFSILNWKPNFSDIDFILKSVLAYNRISLSEHQRRL